MSGGLPVPTLARIDPALVRSGRDLAPLIDHTVLRLDASEDDVLRACDEALQHGFAGVCVRESRLACVVRRLRPARRPVSPAGPPVEPEAVERRTVLAIAVADFPGGAAAPAVRAEEVRRLAGAGAAEIDVVYPLPLLAARDHAGALRDLEALVRAAGPARLKVILETAALSEPEKAAACAVAAASGASWVKTSTGFGPGGATEADVALLRALVGDRLGVKASGGIRSAADALRMVRAGASRLGTSSGVAIVTGAA